MTLIETQYLPSVAWCAAVWGEQKVAIDAAEHYQKGSLRNRCYLASPNGPHRLSIPLQKGKHQQTPIRDVRIAYDQHWQRQHWRSILAVYGNAPFFEHYADDIRPFFERQWVFLFDLNQAFLELILRQKLGWKGEWIYQNDYVQSGEWLPGPDFRGHVAGLAQEWPAWYFPKRYPQVFEERTGFLPNMSVLDLLFCCGKTSIEVLKESFVLPN